MNADRPAGIFDRLRAERGPKPQIAERQRRARNGIGFACVALSISFGDLAMLSRLLGALMFCAAIALTAQSSGVVAAVLINQPAGTGHGVESIGTTNKWPDDFRLPGTAGITDIRWVGWGPHNIDPLTRPTTFQISLRDGLHRGRPVRERDAVQGVHARA
jgi:hypothetical protein